MQDIIEGNDISSWQLFAIALQASVMLMIVALMPTLANSDESF